MLRAADRGVGGHGGVEPGDDRADAIVQRSGRERRVHSFPYRGDRPRRNGKRGGGSGSLARMAPRRLRLAMGGLRTNVIGFDDAPFERGHRGDVPLVGVVCARTRIDGILVSKIRRDGANATRAMVAMVEGSQFRAHVQAVLLQGIAVGGFNVVDVHALHEALGVPVIAIARKEPDREAMRRALFTRVPGAARKWRLLEQAGTMEPLRGVWVQRVGITRDHAREVLVATTLHGNLPEPLRVAHLFAGAMVTGRSRGGA